MSDVVRYQLFDGSDGIGLDADKHVCAYVNGQMCDRSQLPLEEDLKESLRRYQIPELLPKTSFALNQPRSAVVEIDWDGIVSDGYIGGLMRYETKEQSWVARLGNDSLFALARRALPAQARPWTASYPLMQGYELFVEPTLENEPDRVFRQRVALCLERFLHLLEDGRMGQMPYRQQVSNVFSSANPTWVLGVPRIMTALERRQLDL